MSTREILKVGFIDFDEDETDLGLSFAIYQGADYSDSIILARSVYERLADPSERGVRFSYGEMSGTTDNDLIMLEEAILTDSMIELACTGDHRFTLDLSKLDESDMEVIEEQLKKLNHDNRFKFTLPSGENYDAKADLNLALCWYKPEEWEKLKQTADDADKLDDTYKEWKKNANDLIRNIRSSGRQVQKIDVKIDDLQAWCKAESAANNSESRSRYVTEVARQRQKKSTLKA